MPRQEQIRMRTEKEQLEHFAPPEPKQLPQADQLVSDAVEAVKLMQEGIEIKERMEADVQRLEEIKRALLEIQIAHDVRGFKYMDLAFIGSYVKGRRLLNKELLLENGCPPDVIQRSYKEGEASWRRELKRLGQ